MSTIVTPGIGHVGTKGELAEIRALVAVEDATWERFGRVADVRTDGVTGLVLTAVPVSIGVATRSRATTQVGQQECTHAPRCPFRRK